LANLSRGKEGIAKYQKLIYQSTTSTKEHSHREGKGGLGTQERFFTCKSKSKNSTKTEFRKTNYKCYQSIVSPWRSKQVELLFIKQRLNPKSLTGG
jgi:ribosomal protein L44E